MNHSSDNLARRASAGVGAPHESAGAEGEVVFEITVTHEPTGSPVGVLRSNARPFRTPRVVGQLSLPIDVTLQLTGRYTVTLAGNGVPLATRPLDVLLLEGDLPHPVFRVHDGS